MGKLTIVGRLPRLGQARLTLTDGLIKKVELGEFGASEADLYWPESYLTAGFIDLQINGGLGEDLTRNPQSIYELARQLPRWGCTAFLPTLITSEFDQYQKSLQIIGDALREAQGARVLGAHLEGPYLNARFKGAHDSRFLRPPSLAETQKLVKTGVVRMMTLAPELPGSLELIGWLVGAGVVVSTGHSAASYDEAGAAFEAGATYVTHLFNAMPPLHHRTPGLIAAALDPRQPHRPYFGLILDGVHVDPALARTLLAGPARERLTLVTDAVAGLGMPPGRYKLAGQDVIVDEQAARLNNEARTLAGSILTIDQAVRNAVDMLDIPLAQAVKFVTAHPAAVLKLGHKLGQLEPGFLADLVVLDRELQVQMTIVNGQPVYDRTATVQPSASLV